MRILLAGAGGNIGKGIVPLLLEKGHQLVLSDLNTLPTELKEYGLPFLPADVQNGFGLEKAAEGCDLILHTPAWHGIHCGEKTEADFWRLNVDGTFWALQAAKSQGISRFVFLSSQAWHGHYHKYGFTKRIGEELCEYHRCENGLSYVSVRPNDLTPWRNWVGYGTRLLYGGVDRGDVLDSIICSVEFLGGSAGESPAGVVVDALRANAFTEEEIANWEENPIAACEAIFPGSAELVEKYQMNISRKPRVENLGEGGRLVGYEPKVHFGTFLAKLREVDASGGPEAVSSVTCPY